MSKYAVPLHVVVEARSKKAAITTVAVGISRALRPGGALRDFLVVHFPPPGDVQRLTEEQD